MKRLRRIWEARSEDKHNVKMPKAQGVCFEVRRGANTANMGRDDWCGWRIQPRLHAIARKDPFLTLKIPRVPGLLVGIWFVRPFSAGDLFYLADMLTDSQAIGQLAYCRLYWTYT